MTPLFSLHRRHLIRLLCQRQLNDKALIIGNQFKLLDIRGIRCHEAVQIIRCIFNRIIIDPRIDAVVHRSCLLVQTVLLKDPDRVAFFRVVLYDIRLRIHDFMHPRAYLVKERLRNFFPALEFAVIAFIKRILHNERARILFRQHVAQRLIHDKYRRAPVNHVADRIMHRHKFHLRVSVRFFIEFFQLVIYLNGNNHPAAFFLKIAADFLVRRSLFIGVLAAVYFKSNFFCHFLSP